MRHYLNLDPDGYVLSVSKTNTGGPVVKKLDGLDLSGRRIEAHRWDGKKLILDEEKLAQIEAEDTPEPEVPGDKPSQEDRIADLEEALELLLSGVTE